MRYSRTASYNDPHMMFPSASKLFSGMNSVAGNVASDNKKKKPSMAGGAGNIRAVVIAEEDEGNNKATTALQVSCLVEQVHQMARTMSNVTGEPAPMPDLSGLGAGVSGHIGESGRRLTGACRARKKDLTFGMGNRIF
jgi:hypothetical protein